MRRRARERGATRTILGAFLLSVAGSIGFVVAFMLDTTPRPQGLALGAALAGVGAGLALWARRLMPMGPFEEERADVTPPRDEEEAAAEAFREGEARIGRRRLLGGGLAATGGVLAVALVWPVSALGPRPGTSLRATPWRRGARVVDATNRPLTLADLGVGGIVTVFPEGQTNAVDAQALLIRVRPGESNPAPGREEWTPGGYVAYSKVCTHAGCSVGLYQRRANVLICPCHQGSFAVLDAARPVFGPAPRPLPQLPLGVDAEGFLVARGDFSAPVGPSFWNLR